MLISARTVIGNPRERSFRDLRHGRRSALIATRMRTGDRSSVLRWSWQKGRATSEDLPIESDGSGVTDLDHGR
jgi:hypothetical protein